MKVKKINFSNAAGILNWLDYADLGFDEYITKSISLNGSKELYDFVKKEIYEFKKLNNIKEELNYNDEKNIIDYAYQKFEEQNLKSFKKYWNGLNQRSGWNPPNMVRGINKEGKEYFVNRMGLLNPGVQEMIRAFKKYAHSKKQGE